jgi:gamma-glutamylcyclotransferase (GGCT)/AIG2-like uncharacterized protein YtfP
MDKTFYHYNHKLYGQNALLNELYHLNYESIKRKLGFSMIVTPATVFRYILRTNRVDQVICVNVYGQLKKGGNAHELLTHFFVDERFNKTDKEIEGYQLCFKEGAHFPWAIPQEGSSILTESFWLYAEALNTLDVYEGNLYNRIQLDDGSYLYICDKGSEFIPFEQKRRACWSNGKEVIPETIPAP